MGEGGDISELRGLLVVVPMLGLMVLLIGQIPTNFYTAGDMRFVTPPDEWEGVDLPSFAEFWNSTSIQVLTDTFDIGGRNLEWVSNEAGDSIYLLHLFGIGLLESEGGTWKDRKGATVSFEGTQGHQEINDAVLDAEYSGYGNMRFYVSYEVIVFQLQVFFSFNETTYNNPSTAWANDDLNVGIGVEWDETNTQLSAWDIIGSLLFFQLPDLGVTIVSTILAVPLWVCIGYIAFVIIRALIPFT